MNTITIKECIYNIHPVFNLYASNQNGQILHIGKTVLMVGNKRYNGYMSRSIRKIRV